jgi:LPXTG-motif cell wall-anchored protein
MMQVLKRGALAGALIGTTLVGSGAVTASDYPPSDPGAPVVGERPQGLVRGPTAALPATGSDSNSTVTVAGAIVVTGLGLVIVSGVRRRAATR